MISGSTRAFIFIQIAAGRPARACAISPAMCRRMLSPQAERRDCQTFEFGRFGVTGDVIEDSRDIARDHRIGRE